MSIMAKPGMGKTTILFQLLSALEGSARTVFLFQTLCSPNELLRGLLRGLGVIDEGGDAIRMQEQLYSLLLDEARQRRRVVVVIDEAQNLEDSALELVRMLSNFETTTDKLMQIVLSGQPQLREKLASPQLLQLRQRMSIFARLQPFSVEDTKLYIHHRLRVAGYDFRTPLFTPGAEALISKYSEGVPRNINNICFNALSLGYVLKQKSIREEVIRESLDDLSLSGEKVFDRNAERKFFAFGASKVAAPIQQPSLWRRQFALCVVLLLPFLLVTGGRQGREALRSHSSAVISLSQMGAPMLMDHPGSADTALHGGHRATFVPVSSAGDSFGSMVGISSASAQESRQRPRHEVEQPTDPAKLWEKVKNANSDAEIELARLYMEGTTVARNCTQAQLLLLAASRTGNARAADMLSNYGDRCR